MSTHIRKELSRKVPTTFGFPISVLLSPPIFIKEKNKNKKVY